MFAKSISESSPADRRAAPHWSRKAVTLVMCFASFAALALLLHERYGAHWLESAYAAVENEAKHVSERVLAPQPAPQAQPAAVARYTLLAEFLARRYKVSPAVTLEFVQIAHAEGKRVGLDPLLVMAVIAVESGYNPIAESEVGAKGLMQIIPKYHGDKLAEFGGEKAVFDPESNIRVGTRILREYLARTGNLSIALQMYAGALEDSNDTYTNKVLAEKQRLQRVVASLVEPAATPLRVAYNTHRIRDPRRTDSPLGD